MALHRPFRKGHVFKHSDGCRSNAVKAFISGGAPSAWRHTVINTNVGGLTRSDVSKGTFSMDLSGPHPAAFSGHRYFLVANLCTGGEFPDVPFVRLLRIKKAEKVCGTFAARVCDSIMVVCNPCATL